MFPSTSFNPTIETYYIGSVYIYTYIYIYYMHPYLLYAFKHLAYTFISTLNPLCIITYVYVYIYIHNSIYIYIHICVCPSHGSVWKCRTPIHGNFDSNNNDKLQSNLHKSNLYVYRGLYIYISIWYAYVKNNMYIHHRCPSQISCKSMKSSRWGSLPWCCSCGTKGHISNFWAPPCDDKWPLWANSH